MKKYVCLILMITTLIFLGNAWAALPVTDGLVMDLDADTILGVADGDPIATWFDSSSAGNDATQPTTGNQPIYIASNPAYAGHATVQFDGVDDWMTLPSTTINVGSFTMFAVAQYNHMDNNQYIVAGQDGGGNDRIRFQLDQDQTPPKFEFRAGSSGWKAITVDADLEIHVFGETSTVEGFLDGVSVGTAANTSTENPTAFNIGSYNRGQKDFFSGDLAELVIFNRVLSSTEITAVSDYLAVKWSSSLVTDLYPENGQDNVELDVTLMWEGLPDPVDENQLDPNVVAHHVYIDFDNTDTDPNLIYQGSVIVSDWSNRTASYGPLSLSLDQSVSWRIEEALDTGSGAAGDPNNIFGPVWSFAAQKSIPIVPADQPVSLRVFPVDGAIFTVDFTSISAAVVKWYYNDNTSVTEVTTGVTTTDDSNGNYTTTLDLGTPVDTSDEGQYYCSVSNDGGLDWYDSGVADLVVKRQLAKYDFDGDLTDNSSNAAPTGAAMDSQGDPNSALAIAATINYVVGADDTANGAVYLDPNEFIDFSTDGYPKASPVTSNGFGSGLDEGTVILWVKPNVDVQQVLLANFNGDDKTGFMTMLQADQDFDLYVRDADDHQLAAHPAGQPDRPEYDLTDDNWHMMAACWSGGNSSLYVDGQPVADGSGSSATSFGAWQYGVLLGSARDSSDRILLTDTFAGGAIDNLRVYNYRLDDAGVDAFAQEYLDNTGIQPCINPSFLDGLSGTNFDNTGSSYCKVDLADFAAFAETWLVSGLYPLP